MCSSDGTAAADASENVASAHCQAHTASELAAQHRGSQGQRFRLSWLSNSAMDLANFCRMKSPTNVSKPAAPPQGWHGNGKAVRSNGRWSSGRWAVNYRDIVCSGGEPSDHSCDLRDDSPPWAGCANTPVCCSITDREKLPSTSQQQPELPHSLLESRCKEEKPHPLDVLTSGLLHKQGNKQGQK